MISQSIENLTSWLCDIALPFWGTVGFNDKRHAFHERMDFDSNPIINIPQRTMLQARQVYVFAHAYKLGWYYSGKELALAAANTLVNNHYRPDNLEGWVFSVTNEGNVYDNVRDSYAHAFALYGLAWAYMLSNDPKFLMICNSTLNYLDTELSDQEKGGLKTRSVETKITRMQNPHMHYMEAMLAWYEATGDSKFLARAGEIFGLFISHFYQSKTGILAEYFDSNWQPLIRNGGQVFEPGHHMEWIWLLRKYQKYSGRNVDGYVGSLFNTACEHGISKNFLIYDECIDTYEVFNRSTRSWPVTEGIKAVCAQHEYGFTGMRGLADNFANSLFDNFLAKPFKAGWIDHLDAKGSPKVNFVPASTLYHIFLACAEANRCLV